MCDTLESLHLPGNEHAAKLFQAYKEQGAAVAPSAHAVWKNTFTKLAGA